MVRSALIERPRLMSVTSIVLTPPLVVVLPRASASRRPQAVAAMIAIQLTANNEMRWIRIVWLLKWELRQTECLSGVNQIRVLNGVAVGVVDLAPFLRVTVQPLGDLREAVARHHDVGARRRRLARLPAGRGRRAPALHVAEIGFGHGFLRPAVSRERGSCDNAPLDGVRGLIQ